MKRFFKSFFRVFLYYCGIIAFIAAVMFLILEKNYFVSLLLLLVAGVFFVPAVIMSKKKSVKIDHENQKIIDQDRQITALYKEETKYYNNLAKRINSGNLK